MSTGQAGADPRQYVYTQPLRPVGRWLIGLLLLAIVGNAVLLAAGLGELSLIDRIRSNVVAVSQDDVDRADRFFGTTIFVLLALTILTSIVFVVWLYKARRNVAEWSPRFQRHSPGWAIGGWLCPVVNLWFPYRILFDVWDDTVGARRRRPVVLAWWISYVAGAPLFLISSSIGGGTGRSRADFAFSVGAAVVTLMSLLLAVVVVQGLTEAQTRRRAQAYAAIRA